MQILNVRIESYIQKNFILINITNKYKMYSAYSYGYKLVCIGDKFSKPFKTHLGKDAVYNFVR